MSLFTDDDYFTGPQVTPELVRHAEGSLGFLLPASYLKTLEDRNGGVLIRSCFAVNSPTSWAPDHVRIAALRGISGEWGIDNTDGVGSRDMIAEWDYPNIGIVICEMPSGGHDAVMLDYSEAGEDGDPAVVYVDEDRYVRRLASTFDEFIDQLTACSTFSENS